MNTTIYKAQPTGDRHAPDLRLEALQPLPLLREYSEADCLGLYKQQGELLADALQASLPGGTIDALMVALLDRTRSQLAVAYRGNWP